ncbi:MAG: asparagine synthase (glutamine-hydrolyzing) [Nitrospirae bacterium]|nr:MAG: asparagine synthase (glutamine-hydrolyzing) [Nitrospirota bacterium]
MCGICGVWNRGTGEAVRPELIKAMADRLIHRGPDEEGVFVHGPVGLGHRRLSIIDLEGGHQPMPNEDRTIWVAFNGEIYNFLELHHELESKGHRFKTRSDTEVLVHAYEEYGLQCFPRLRGMFAIALWDQRRHQLILARDRVGKKPLYYYLDADRVVFGSEIKALLAVPGIPREVDFEALSDYFSLLYVPAPKSIYKGIRKVRPGHVLVCSEEGSLVEQQYWDLEFDPDDRLALPQWTERLDAVLTDAVKARLISDVPLGAFLSGGLDSSAVVGVMSHILDHPVRTASIGFEEERFNELAYARTVAEWFHTDHTERVVRPDAAKVVEELAWFYDEPFADSSAVPTFYVSQAARQCVTVALSGDGGDENFAGYRRYRFDAREEALRRWVPPVLRQWVFRPLAHLYPKLDWAPRVFRAKATFESLACSHVEGYFRSVSGMSPEMKSQLLHGDVLRALGDYRTQDLFETYYRKHSHLDAMSRILYLDIKTYLTDDILVKVDRASMAHSLEVRAPLLDHHLMECAARIPWHLKLHRGEGKYVFKETLKRILPDNILRRPKMGFAIPLAEWLRGDLKPLAQDILFSSQDQPFVNPQTVLQWWNEHQKGIRDRSTPLWIMLMFQLWHNRWHRADSVASG